MSNDNYDNYVLGWHVGYETALRNFAWMKDGTFYVGSGLITLEEALAEIPAERKRNRLYPETTRRLKEPSEQPTSPTPNSDQ